MIESLPAQVESVLREFRVCEFSTISKDGTPITWPLVTRYDREGSRFILTTSIGFPQKAFNVRQNPHVSMLFSDPTGSGLENPPAVLVQGNASAPQEVVVAVDGLEYYWRESIFRRQPATSMISNNPLMRYFMDWYYMRIVITVIPISIFWWPEGDFTQPVWKAGVEDVE